MIQEQKSSRLHRLAGRYREGGLFTCDTVTIHGTHGATVYGCRRILHYSPSEICLCVGQRMVRVLGEALYCASFTAGAVTVGGKIGGVVFDCTAEGGKK